MYAPYSNDRQRNKSRVYFVLCLLVVFGIVYWKYSPAARQSVAKEQLPSGDSSSVVEQAKEKVDRGIEKLKEQVDQGKDKLQKELQQGADAVKEKL